MQLTPKGIIGILSNLQDPYLTIAQLMYGAGLRLMEAMLNCRRLHSIAMIEGITHVDMPYAGVISPLDN
jgi:hypothetical protein